VLVLIGEIVHNIAYALVSTMDAIVQFYREGLSCVKDLGLFQGEEHDASSPLSFIYDPSVTLRYYNFPAPLHQTTPLEVFISLGQLYAVVSLVKTGWTTFATSIGKMMRIQRLVETRKAPPVFQQRSTDDGKKDEMDRWIHASLVKEGMLAIRGMVNGFILFFIGFCFIWLFANSWHITETNWIGGLQGLIHAFTVMNIGLVPLLYYMWKDGHAHLAKAKGMENMVDRLRAGTLKRHDLDLGSLETITGWKPFWEAGVSLVTNNWTTCMLAMALEKTTIENSLDEVFGGRKVEKKKNGGDGEKKDDHDGDDGEKESKIRHELRQAKADEISSAAYVIRMEGYREFIYFILNCVAFYGYFLCIICFYYPHPYNNLDEQQVGAAGRDATPFNATTTTTTTPLLVRHLMFHMDPQLADWRGNFAGDFMWTVEGLVTFGSPFLISWLKPTTKKAASTTASTAIKTKVD
jgi:hypothetical protein